MLFAQIYTRNTSNYIFSVPPVYYTQDLAYTFYNEMSYQRNMNVTVARVR